MSFWNKYPYTDFHELNIDWVLTKIKEMLSRLGILENRVNEHEERITNIEGDIEVLEGAVDDLSSRVGGFNQRITAVENSVTNINIDIDNLQTSVVGFDQRITNMEQNETKIITDYTVPSNPPEPYADTVISLPHVNTGDLLIITLVGIHGGIENEGSLVIPFNTTNTLARYTEFVSNTVGYEYIRRFSFNAIDKTITAGVLYSRSSISGGAYAISNTRELIVHEVKVLKTKYE